MKTRRKASAFYIADRALRLFLYILFLFFLAVKAKLREAHKRTNASGNGLLLGWLSTHYQTRPLPEEGLFIPFI